MKRIATAVWNGSFKDGHGLISTDSGVLNQAQYSAGTRFEEAKGTNPEELIAAAHAGCFSMALSLELVKAGKSPERIDTEAAVTLAKTDAGFTVTAVHLKVRGKVPGVTPPEFKEVATKAKEGCPISRLLKAEITMETRLEGWT
jgi:lipoyl-dependent peroxiredoxin